MRRAPLVCLQCSSDGCKVSKDHIYCSSCGYLEKARDVPSSKAVEVEVTEEDIEKAEALRERGAKNAAKWCPIAQALARSGYRDISVGPLHFCASDKVFASPGSVIDAVATFDEEEKVEPFKFLIEDLFREV